VRDLFRLTRRSFGLKLHRERACARTIARAMAGAILALNGIRPRKSALSDHPNPANGYHLKTGQRNSVRDIDTPLGLVASEGMANVLNEEKKQQVLALGRLGWSLRRSPRAIRRISKWNARKLRRSR
jgi:hypothetical protein